MELRGPRPTGFVAFQNQQSTPFSNWLGVKAVWVHIALRLAMDASKERLKVCAVIPIDMIHTTTHVIYTSC